NLIADNQIDKNKTLRLMDTVELKQEEADPDEYDEHIWTSIPNTTKMLTAIKDKLIQIDPKNTNTYERQAASYVQKLTELDQEIRSIVANSSRKELVFADRFPFLYFVTEYGLDYTAAFPGCSEQTEASSQTISTLIDKVKKGHIPVILKIEMTPDNLAQTISEATNAKILTLYSAHNISAEDFEKGTTYLDLLEKNVDTLKKALN
ncbi:zinc ABC transporter substrate-binding protein, partial [Candidatus Saccharibacteria bacterium]|nr:zinc ABC transporter substrate-binding protein [Candidatus Saccharibacteria bacterium]